MSKDFDNQRKAQADASSRETDDAAGADRTVEISRAELAAIRQSASQPAISRERLSEMDRRPEKGRADQHPERPRQRQQTPLQPPAVDDNRRDDDSTRTFSRQSIDAMLRGGSMPAETPATSSAPQDPVDNADPETVEVPLDDSALPAAHDELDVFSALSDEDIHELVFNDDAPAPPAPATDGPPVESPASPASPMPADDLLNDVNTQQQPSEFEGSVEVDEDQPAKEQADEPQQEPETSIPTPARDEEDTPAPTDTVGDTPADPPTATLSPSRRQPTPTLNTHEEAVDFRNPHARGFAIGVGVLGIAALLASAARLATPDAVLPPSFLGLISAGVATLLLVASTALCAVAIWLLRQ